MKKVVDISIGRTNFIIEDDAYLRLKLYLSDYEKSLPEQEYASEIMEDIEIRIAELFQKDIKYSNQTISLEIVNSVIRCLGELDMNSTDKTNANNSNINNMKISSEKKLYRNPDDQNIAGVCSGLSLYFNIDTTLIRVLFVMLFIFGFGSPVLVYIVLWIIMPKATTIAQKLEMRGEAVTAESIKNYNLNSIKK